MDKNDILDAVAGIIGAVGLLLLIILIVPFICFWGGYFGGWVAKIIIGDPLCRALNILFDTKYFVKDMLPWLGGALAWIGHYFRSTNTVSKKNKK